MATIKDVAQMAGVSIATVSNYLNHTKPVSKEISKKIQYAVDKLHYAQNQNARNLKAQINTDIGIILPNLNDSYYVQLFQGQIIFPEYGLLFESCFFREYSGI